MGKSDLELSLNKALLNLCFSGIIKWDPILEEMLGGLLMIMFVDYLTICASWENVGGGFFGQSLLVSSFLMFFEVSMCPIYEEIVLYTLEVSHHFKTAGSFWMVINSKTHKMAKLGVSKLSKMVGSLDFQGVYDLRLPEFGKLAPSEVSHGRKILLWRTGSFGWPL